MDSKKNNSLYDILNPNSKIFEDRKKPRYIKPNRYFKNIIIIPTFLLKCEHISDGAKLLFGLLCRFCGKNAWCWPRQDKLAEELGVSTRTLSKYVKELVTAGLIYSEKRAFGKSNKYYLLHEENYEPAIRKNLH